MNLAFGLHKYMKIILQILTRFTPINEQWDRVVGARVLGRLAMARGLERTRHSKLDVRSTVKGFEGRAQSTRVTENHVETMDSTEGEKD